MRMKKVVWSGTKTIVKFFDKTIQEQNFAILVVSWLFRRSLMVKEDLLNQFILSTNFR